MNTGETIALIKAFGKGGGGGSNKFIVTLTPTSPDFSGTMNKTVAQIKDAYDAGMEIAFAILTGGSTYYIVSATIVDKESDDYPSFSGFGVLTEMLVQIYTPSTMDGTENTYSTAIYTLTPAS